jgi:hypothetical protein
MVSKKVLVATLADGIVGLYTLGSTIKGHYDLPKILEYIRGNQQMMDTMTYNTLQNYDSLKMLNPGATQAQLHAQLNALLAQLDKDCGALQSLNDKLVDQYNRTCNSINTNLTLVLPTLLALEVGIITSPYWGPKVVKHIKDSNMYKRIRGKIEGHSVSVARKKVRNQKPLDLGEGMLSRVLS